MSYQVIARKWRPQTFEEVTGQEVITQTLRNALEFDRLHHAYLFSGARGVGKTTTARILAKALNCHKTDRKPNLTPCLLTDPDICPSCLEVSESRSMDVLEIDAASHTGIDDVRETIIENINFSPARDRYKVFIIDEVHQLSKPAFNALLKTLEEPPDNVVFIMATTELHKVPETILSRCQQFEFRTIPLQKIFDRLKLIANAEQIAISDDALRELARSGEGSMRDAQSNFDQVISFSGDEISAEDVTNALGFAGVEILTRTLKSITDRDARLALNVVDDLISRGHDLRNFCRDLLGLFRDLLVFKVADGDKALFDGAVFSEDAMRAMADGYAEADLLRFFNSMCETEAGLREAAHPRYVLEIGLVKLIEMRSVASIESILERLDALSTGVALPKGPVGENTRAARAPVDAVPEKKTLKSDPVSVSRHDSAVEEPEEPPIDLTSFGEPDPAEPLETAVLLPTQRMQQLRLLSLSAEELEHFDDERLDSSYEEKLRSLGDDLLPLPGAVSIVSALLGSMGFRPAFQNARAASGSAAAAAPALDLAKFRDERSPQPDDTEPQPLGQDPTPDELLAYANAHPAVRTAMRVFRAKVVEVKKA
jgi:DNA polymerase-3 subunit gamma/tau